MVREKKGGGGKKGKRGHGGLGCHAFGPEKRGNRELKLGQQTTRTQGLSGGRRADLRGAFGLQQDCARVANRTARGFTCGSQRGEWRAFVKTASGWDLDAVQTHLSKGLQTLVAGSMEGKGGKKKGKGKKGQGNRFHLKMLCVFNRALTLEKGGQMSGRMSGTRRNKAPRLGRKKGVSGKGDMKVQKKPSQAREAFFQPQGTFCHKRAGLVP